MSESDLTEFEGELRSLVPHPGRLDRDALLYAGGRASAKAARWRAATVAFAALSLALGVLLAVRPTPPIVERIVYVQNEPENVPEPTFEAPPPSISREKLIEQVFLRGLDGLPDVIVEEAPALPPGATEFD